jgi:hypothetical protein
LDFTSVQSSHGNLVESWRFIEKHWNRTPVKPVIDLESSYPDAYIQPSWLPERMRADHRSTGPSNDDDARRAAYWAVFAGACGHTYGHNSIWQMYEPPRKPILNPKLTWREALPAPSAAQMGYLRRLIESRPMPGRLPDQEWISDGPPEAEAHVRATRGEGYAMVYAPTGVSFNLRLERLGVPRLRCRWFNPRTGSTTEPELLPGSGVRSFDPPGEPGPGRDWVLVLEDATRRFPLPGGAGER